MNLRGTCDGQEILVKSLRNKWDLFTFFHEVGHACMHYGDDCAKHEKRYGTSSGHSQMEREANEFAKEIMLIIYGDTVRSLCDVCSI